MMTPCECTAAAGVPARAGNGAVRRRRAVCPAHFLEQHDPGRSDPVRTVRVALSNRPFLPFESDSKSWCCRRASGRPGSRSAANEPARALGRQPGTRDDISLPPEVIEDRNRAATRRHSGPRGPWSRDIGI